MATDDEAGADDVEDEVEHFVEPPAGFENALDADAVREEARRPLE